MSTKNLNSKELASPTTFAADYETLYPKLGAKEYISSFFLMCKAMIGCGVLALANASFNTGTIFSVGMLLIMAYMTWLSLHYIITVCLEIGGKDLSFYAASKELAPRFKLVTDISIFIYAIFAGAGYLIVASGSLDTVIRESFDIGVEWRFWIRAGSQLMIVALLSPVCFLSSLSKATIPNMIGLLALLVVYSMAFRPMIGAQGAEKAIIHDAKGWSSIIGFFPTFLLAYCCQGSIFGVMNDLKGASIKGLSTVCGAVSLAGALIYLPAAIIPLYAFGSDIKPNFLDSLKINNFDWILKSGYFCAAVSVIISYPLMIHPASRCLMIVLFGSSQEHPSGVKPRYIITSSLIAATLFVGIFLADSLDLVFNVCGLLGGNTMGFLMPALLYIKAYQQRPNMASRSKFLYYQAQIIFIISILMYPLCLYGIISNFLASKNNDLAL